MEHYPHKWTVQDRYGNIVYMTAERWRHALEKRLWLADSAGLILLGLDHQIQAERGIWQSPRSDFRSTETILMDEQLSVHYEYDKVGDVLDIYFGENKRAWTIELTENIMISIDHQTGKVVSLTLLDFTELVRPTPVGPRSFPLTGLDTLPADERDLVIQVLTASPVSALLDVSLVLSPPASPLPIIHLERRPVEKFDLVPVAVSYS